MIELYTDGSSTGRVGPGGWAYVILKDGTPIRADREAGLQETNNTMELSAIKFGLIYIFQNNLHLNTSVDVISDSQYALNICDRNCNVNNNKELANETQKYFTLCNASTRWIRGHSGNIWNARCDSLAKEIRIELQESLGTYKKRAEKKMTNKRRKKKNQGVSPETSSKSVA